AKLLPVGEQLVQGARLEDRTGENVSADFGTLLDHADPDLFAGVGGLLFQSAGGGQAGGAGADDDDVEFHKFAFHRESPDQGFFGVVDLAMARLSLACALALYI